MSAVTNLIDNNLSGYFLCGFSVDLMHILVLISTKIACLFSLIFVSFIRNKNIQADLGPMKLIQSPITIIKTLHGNKIFYYHFMRIQLQMVSGYTKILPEFLVFVALRIVLEKNLLASAAVFSVWQTIIVRSFVISSIVDLIWSCW